MNAEQLAEIKARCEAATPGPWLNEPQDDSVWSGWDGSLQIAHCQSVPGAGMLHDRKVRRANGIFIAESRSDIPALLAEVARLRSIESAAIAQSEDVQVNFLSPFEAAGLRAENAKLRLALEEIVSLPTYGWSAEMCATMQRIATLGLQP